MDEQKERHAPQEPEKPTPTVGSLIWLLLILILVLVFVAITYYRSKTVSTETDKSKVNDQYTQEVNLAQPTNNEPTK